MDVPAATARRARVAPLPAAARRGVRELRVLGTVPLPAGRADGYHNRLVEDEVARLDGHKSLYSTSFYAEDDFYRRYNGEAYRALKRAYDGEGRLLGLYEKCVTGR